MNTYCCKPVLTLLAGKKLLAKEVREKNGFTVLELVAVVTILAILAGISIPAFTNIIKSSRIDQAKASLNKAIAECLQNYRTDPDNADTALVPADNLNGLAEAGYTVVDGKDKCSDFMLKPRDPNENYLFQMGFMVRNGRVTKIAIPASNRSSENACKSWGTCGVSPELQAEWDKIDKIEADKKACNDTFYQWLNDKNSGQKNRWDDSSNSCSKQTWAFEGTIQANEEAFKAARDAKLGRICAQKLKDQENSSFDGNFVDTTCGINTWFFRGKDLGTADKTIYDAESRKYQEQQCQAAEASWLAGNSNGAFTSPPGLSCNAKWKCGTQIFTDEASYNSSQCAPKKPDPNTDDNSNCSSLRRRLGWCQ